jgi:hypothetical protein
VFVLQRDGTVVYGRLPRWSPSWAPGAISHPDPRTWVAHPARRLAVYRDGRLLWRSHVTGGTDNVAVGQGHVAFTSYRRRSGLRWAGMTLWVAPLDGPERLVARNENAVGWTAGGLVTNRGASVWLRGRDGHLLRSLGTARPALPDGDHVVLLRQDGTLVRTNGWRSSTVANLRAAGLTGHPWVQRLAGGLWQVDAGRRHLFLRHDGRPFATVTFAPDVMEGVGSAIAGSAVRVDGARAVAFVVDHRRSIEDPGVYTVYRLDRGRRLPRPLWTSQIRRLSCGGGAELAYRSGRLLFTGTDAGIAILDPDGRGQPIDLTSLARRLTPSADGSVSAYWQG